MLPLPLLNSLQKSRVGNGLGLAKRTCDGDPLVHGGRTIWIRTAVQQEPDQLSGILIILAIGHIIQWCSASFAWPPLFRVYVKPNHICEVPYHVHALFERGIDDRVVGGIIRGRIYGGVLNSCV